MGHQNTPFEENLIFEDCFHEYEMIENRDVSPTKRWEMYLTKVELAITRNKLILQERIM